MITNELKAKRGKCLALAAVLAMVVCAFAIAMPAGNNDASVAEPVEIPNAKDLKELKTGETIEAGKNYYVRTDATISNASGTGTVNVYIVGTASITFSSAYTGVHVFLASDGDADKAPTMYYEKLDIVTSGTTYTGMKATDDAPAGISAGAAAGTGSTYGVCVQESASVFKYYPEGADVTVTLAAAGTSVTVLNGGVVTINGKGPGIDNTILLEKVTSESATAVTASGAADGSLKIKGTFTAGTVKMEKGQVLIDEGGMTLGDAKLNAYAQLKSAGSFY